MLKNAYFNIVSLLLSEVNSSRAFRNQTIHLLNMTCYNFYKYLFLLEVLQLKISVVYKIAILLNSMDAYLYDYMHPLLLSNSL